MESQEGPPTEFCPELEPSTTDYSELCLNGVEDIPSEQCSDIVSPATDYLDLGLSGSVDTPTEFCPELEPLTTDYSDLGLLGVGDASTEPPTTDYSNLGLLEAECYSDFNLRSSRVDDSLVGDYEDLNSYAELERYSGTCVEAPSCDYSNLDTIAKELRTSEHSSVAYASCSTDIVDDSPSDINYGTIVSSYSSSTAADYSSYSNGGPTSLKSV